MSLYGQGCPVGRGSVEPTSKEKEEAMTTSMGTIGIDIAKSKFDIAL